MKQDSNILSIDSNFDLKLESFASEIMRQSKLTRKELKLEEIIVNPLGPLKRKSAYEVREIREKQTEIERVLYINVNRFGLFDNLPEKLMVQSLGEEESAIVKTQSNTRQIKEARKFFLPFEQAFYLPQIHMEELEQEWTEHFPNFIDEIWELDQYKDCLDQRQNFILIHIIPEASRLVGNWDLIGLCFEAVLSKPVNINFENNKEIKIPKSENSMTIDLGSEDAFLGESFFEDIPNLIISIYGVMLHEVESFLPLGKNRRLLEQVLYSYFIPLDLIPFTNIEVTNDTWGFELGQAYLGYTIQLDKN